MIRLSELKPTIFTITKQNDENLKLYLLFLFLFLSLFFLSLFSLSMLIHFRTSLFIVTSLVYAILLIVICIALVISDVSTHRIPVVYYEGYFSYLYGASILFLLYVFCFLLQGMYHLFPFTVNHFCLYNKSKHLCVCVFDSKTPIRRG